MSDDLVGEDREPGVEAAQRALVAVGGDPAREDRHADAGERERLDELEVAAREEPLRHGAALGELLEQLSCTAARDRRRSAGRRSSSIAAARSAG
jgi:hypothetical protein